MEARAGIRKLVDECAGTRAWHGHPGYASAHRKLEQAVKEAEKFAPLKGAGLRDWLRKAVPLVHRHVQTWNSRKKGVKKRKTLRGGDMEEDVPVDADAEAEDAHDRPDAPPPEEPDHEEAVLQAQEMNDVEPQPEPQPLVAAHQDDVEADDARVSAGMAKRITALHHLLTSLHTQHPTSPVGIKPPPQSAVVSGDQEPLEGGALYLPLAPTTALQKPKRRTNIQDMAMRMAYSSPIVYARPTGSQQKLESLQQSLPGAGVVMYNFGGSSASKARTEQVAPGGKKSW